MQLGEIRSTMDLIMERTQGMSLSDEEKEAVRREETGRKARGLRLKLLEDPRRVDQVLVAVQEEEKANRELLWSMIWEKMVEGLIEGEDPFKDLDAMEKLPQARDKSAALKDVRAALHAAVKDKNKDRKKLLTREKKKLASFGISGSAVVPKIPKKLDATSELRAIAESFRERLLENT